MKLDLGCGQRKKEGFVGVDVSPDCGADIVWNLKQIPWRLGEEIAVAVGQSFLPPNARHILADGCVDEVFSSHFFEHLSGPERIRFMDELWRVMKPGAKATIITPYWAGHRAIQDPTHAWPPVCEQSYLYFNRKWREDNKLGHYGIAADFDFTCGYGLDPEVSLRAEDYQRFALKHYLNAVLDLQVVLTKRAASDEQR